MRKIIFRAAELLERPTINIFQKALIYTLGWNSNLTEGQIAAGLKKIYLFPPKTDHFWSFVAFSKKYIVK